MKTTTRTHSKRRKAVKAILIVMGVLVVVAGAAAWWAYKNRTDIFHWMRGEVVIDRSKYPIVGIAVSSHNGDIDFKKVKEQGYSFVIIKASEGEYHHDSRFA